MPQTPTRLSLLALPGDLTTPTGVSRSNALVVLSFDIEEHHRIEAASNLSISAESQVYYRNRMEVSTHWLLDQLAARNAKATFYVVGELAHLSRDLVKEISRAGHEIGSHGWDHRRVLAMDPEAFRQDVRRCKDALEQATGMPVSGFRAPTFSVVRQTIWALEVLAEEGYLYDSSISPVRHDRYGIPELPLTPFTVQTKVGPILELPLLTLRWLGMNLPVGGGGYFRLLPSWFMSCGIRQMSRRGTQNPAVLYFHPWEFDAEQKRLPLSGPSRFRTYTGIQTSQPRFQDLLDAGHRFERAEDLARDLRGGDLPRFDLESIREGHFTPT